MDERRHYYNLSLMQIIKSNVLFDKLVLCFWGYRAFGAGQRDSNALADFFIVRSGVARRIHEYVARLGDLQAQLEAALDLSLQEDPPPLTVRRQEHGFYTSCAAMRCRELQANLDDLLKVIGAPPGPADKPLVMHRWTPSFMSGSYAYSDCFGRRGRGSTFSASETARFINSSYWMPDRPDLLGILAHEVAHGDVRERYRSLRSPALDLQDDCMARLIKLLHWCFRAYGIPSIPLATGGQFASSPGYAIQEIVADLFAASVEGHAYLYATLLDLTTSGIYELLLDPDQEVDIDLANRLHATVEPSRLDYSWYFRLRLLCAWLDVTHHLPAGPLAATLVDGAKSVAGAIFDRLTQLSAQPEKMARVRDLTDEMCRALRYSEAAKVVKAWRLRRSSQVAPSVSDKPAGLKTATAPRFTRRLEVEVRRWLFDALLWRKKLRGRLLENKPGASLATLEERYFGNGSLGLSGGTSMSEADCDAALLFRHLYDVPWECALLRGIDFVHPEAKVPFSSWLRDFHHEAGLGRGLYRVAMEFYLWQTRPPYDRLAASIRLVREVSHRIRARRDGGEVTLAPVLASLDEWRGPVDDADIQHGVAKLFQQVHALVISGRIKRRRGGDWSFVSVGEAVELAGRFSANVLQSATRLCCPAWETPKSVEPALEEAVIEKLQGYKLANLQTLCTEIVKTPGLNDDGARFQEMINYLQLRQAPRNAEPEPNAASTRRCLLAGLSVDHLLLYSLERLAVSSEPLNYEPKSTTGDWRGLQPVMTGSCWISPRTSSLYCISLGRFDVIGLKCESSMLRPGLPSFPDYKRVISSLSNGVRDAVANAGSLAPREVAKLCNGYPEFPGSNWFGHLSLNRLAQEVVKLNPGFIDIVADEENDWKLVHATPATAQSVAAVGQPHDGWHVWHDAPLPFLSRREQAMAFSIGSVPAHRLLDSLLDGTHQPVAFISILLSQRSARLTFLARLRNGSTGVPSSGNNLALSEAAASWCSDGNLFALLSEGWGDVVLCVVREKSIRVDERRLLNIFALQNAIYQDFLVKRTELVLTPGCLAAAAESEFFDISVHLRVRDDGHMRLANERFEEGIIAAVADRKLRLLSLEKVPGKSDYILRLDWTGMFRDGSEMDILNALGSAREEIDDISTAICMNRDKASKENAARVLAGQP
jgi:hypothetical protein